MIAFRYRLLRVETDRLIDIKALGIGEPCSVWRPLREIALKKATSRGNQT